MDQACRCSDKREFWGSGGLRCSGRLPGGCKAGAGLCGISGIGGREREREALSGLGS